MSLSEGGDGESSSDSLDSKGFHENGYNVYDSKSDGRDGFTGTYNQETINRSSNGKNM
jgi:hypothetical protein